MKGFIHSGCSCLHSRQWIGDYMLIILVHNDGTGTEEIADYNYEVRINHDVIAHGRILDHNRKDGWQALIREIADQHQAPIVSDQKKKRKKTYSLGGKQA
jgi:hypothetical protein